jgi:outer membrane biosynthesis protein TonB
VRYDWRREGHRLADLPSWPEMMEQKKQRRKVGFAVLVSVIVHLLVGYSLAAFGNVFTPTIPLAEAPPELTIVDLPEAPSAPKNPQFIETEKSKESAEKPKEQTYESNANSLAASQQPPTGELPLPSQDGKERAHTELETHDFSLQAQGAEPLPRQTPEPKAKPSEPPRSPTPAPSPSAEPEQLAMLTATPPPPMKAPDEPEPSPTPDVAASVAPIAPRPRPESPASNYQAQKQQTRIAGSISNRGPTAVNAVGTPLGRYQKQMYDAVGARWYQHTAERRDLISIGTTRLTFSIDRSGRITNLKVIENTANEAFAIVCLQSVQELKLPPIPADVASTLPPEGLQQELTFILYAN